MTKKETMATVSPATKENIEANNSVFNLVRQTCGFRNDAALSRALQVAPPVISKLRHGRLLVGPSMVIKLHEVSGISIRELKTHLGMTILESRVGNTTTPAVEAAPEEQAAEAAE